MENIRKELDSFELEFSPNWQSSPLWTLDFVDQPNLFDEIANDADAKIRATWDCAINARIEAALESILAELQDCIRPADPALNIDEPNQVQKRSMAIRAA